jgi:hypothetical protein
MGGTERETARIVEYFTALGNRVAAAWEGRGWKAAEFPAIARLALEEMAPPEPPDAIVQWGLTQFPLPDQRDRFDFGDHCFIAYRHPQFRIEVLHWIDGTTSIHEHSFSGAFRVWQGSSIHSLYAFDEEERFGNTCFGKVNFKRSEFLNAGSVREIHAGRVFSHGLFHLERPSVTIVVRNHASLWSLPQLDYHPPFVASTDRLLSDQYLTAISALNMVKRLQPEAFIDTLVAAIQRLDVDAITTIVMRNCVALASSPADFERVITAAAAKFGEVAGLLEHSVHYRARSGHIIAKRDRVFHPDHRFLLACLLNIPTRSGVLEMIRARVSDTDPLDVLTRWLSELVDLPSPLEHEPNLLGFQLCGAPLDVFRLLLSGISEEQILIEVRRSHPDFDEDAGMIRDFAAALARAPLFVPLFREHEITAH